MADELLDPPTPSAATGPDSPTCERVDVDGVPVFWTSLPGELRAALMFRVGYVDEEPVRRGITHLVEHLVLSTIDDGVHHAWNGFVDPMRTVFFAAGEPAEVAAFLAHICRVVGDLPVDRLDTEKRVLQAEAARQPAAGVWADLLHARYGMQGAGLVSLREFALDAAGPAEVTDWADQRFCRDNAAVWLTGEPPVNLALPLVGGRRWPCPSLPPSYVTEPTFMSGGPDGAAFGLITELREPMQVGLTVLEQRLTRRLRHLEGTSYSVGWSGLQIAAAHAHAVVGVDAGDGRAPAAWVGLREEAEALAATPPSEEEVRLAAARIARATRGSEAAPGYLDRVATRELTGRPHRSREAFEAALGTVTPDAVREEFAAAMEAVIYKVPADAGRPDRLAAVAESSSERVTGRTFQPVRKDSPNPRITVGVDGVTAEGTTAEGNERYATVKTADCVAVLWWADGCRSVLGRDGFSVTIDPSAWQGGAEAVAAADAAFAGLPSVRVGRRRRAPVPRPARRGDRGLQLYDDCAATDWSRFPPDLPSTQVYVCCGLVLGWLAVRHLVSDWFLAESGTDIDDFLARRITAPALYERWGGVLASDMMNEEGAAFCRWYIREPDSAKPNLRRRFDKDYSILSARLPSTYHVPDTWATFDRFTGLADQSFAIWRRMRWVSRLMPG